MWEVKKINIKKCNRCGKFYEKNKSKYCDFLRQNIYLALDICLVLEGDEAMGYEDLCNNCIDQVDRLISGHAEFIERKAQ